MASTRVACRLCVMVGYEEERFGLAKKHTNTNVVQLYGCDDRGME